MQKMKTKLDKVSSEYPSHLKGSESGISKIWHELEHVVLLIIVPPDGGYYAWMVVLAAFMVNFLSDGVFYSFGKLLGELSTELNTSQADIASIFSAMNALYYISGPFASAFINRYGFKITGTIGVMLTCSCICLSSIMNSYSSILVLHLIAGIGFGATSLSVTICTGFYFDKYRPIATGLATSGSGAGIFAVERIINHILLKDKIQDKSHWRFFMRYEAIFLVFCLIPVFVLRAPSAQTLTTNVEDASLIKKARFDLIDDDSSSEDDSDSVEVKTISMSRPSMISRNSNLSFHRFPTVSEITPSYHVFTATKPRKFGFLKSVKQWRPCHKSKKKDVNIHEIDVSRPLYRDDILYPGALGNLPQSRRQTLLSAFRPTRPSDVRTDGQAVTLQLSLTRVPNNNQTGKKDPWFTHISSALKILFDVSLLKSPTFLLLLLNGLLYVFGSIIPITFITERAYLAGIDESNAMWLVSAIGLANIFGRVVSGSLMMIPRMESSIFIAVAVAMSGIATIVTGFLPVNGISTQLFYCVVFGLGQSAFVALRPIAYVQQLGLEKLTNAYGITSLFMGVSAALSVPILARIKEETGNYIGTFVTAGFSLLFAGVALLFLPLVRRFEKRRVDAAPKL